MVTKKSKFLSWAVLALFLLSPAGSFAQSIPGGSHFAGSGGGSGLTEPVDVDVLSLPSLPAGTNNIGDVDVLTLPSLPAGSNNIGDVDVVSSVLPTGAATEATLSSANSTLTDINVDISDIAGTIVDNQLTVKNDDIQRSLHAAATTTGDGTTIDVSGATAVLIHATADGSWDRTSTITFQGGIGGGALTSFRKLPYFEYQDSGAEQNPIYRNGQSAASLQAVANDEAGFLVDVTGFQSLKVPITVTGGSAGTMEIHAHVIYNGVRIHNAASALANTPDGTNTGVPDFSLQVSGVDGSGAATILPLADYTVTFPNVGLPVAGNVDIQLTNSFTDQTAQKPHINPQGAQWVVIADEDGNEVVADASGLMVQVGNLCSSAANALCKAEDSIAANGDRGVGALGVINTALDTKAANGDYTYSALADSGAALGVPVYDDSIGSALRATHLEGTDHVTGDAGIAVWGVNNNSVSNLVTGAGDYVPQGRTNTGASLSALIFDFNVGASNQVVVREDTAAFNLDAGLRVYQLRDDILTSGGGVADNDYYAFRGDLYGAQWTHERELGESDYAIERDNISTVSANIAFGFNSRRIELRAPSANTDDICVSWSGGTAVCPAANTAGDYRLKPGETITLDLMESGVSVIADSGTQGLNVAAWN